MNNSAISNIVAMCTRIDRFAYEIYVSLSELTTNNELKKFWINLSIEQSEHSDAWKMLGSLGKKGVIPPIFDDPEKIENEVKEELRKIERLFDSLPVNTDGQFMSAYQLEYHLLHSAFTKLFYFAEILGYDKNPYNDYDSRINNFILALNDFSEESSEMFFIAELLKRLWAESQNSIVRCKSNYYEKYFEWKDFYEGSISLCHFSKRKGEWVGIAILRIDNLTDIKENFGQFACDQIYKQLRVELKGILRQSDIVETYGNQGFALLLNNVDYENLKMVLKKISEQIENSDKIKPNITISIAGVLVFFSENIEETLLETIRKANELLTDSNGGDKNMVIIRHGNEINEY